MCKATGKLVVLTIFMVFSFSHSIRAGSLEGKIVALYKDLGTLDLDFKRSLKVTSLRTHPSEKPDRQTIRLRDSRLLLARLNEIDFQASRMDSKSASKLQTRIKTLRESIWDWEQPNENPSAYDVQTSSVNEVSSIEEGRILGLVSDSTSGDPIRNVDIYAFDSGGNFRAYARTDDQGNYLISGLVGQTYYLLTHNNSGYINELYFGIVCLSGECDPTTGTGIPVPNGAEVTGIDFQLDPGGKMSGTLKDALTGQPIPNSTINIFTTDGKYATYAQSDPAGIFTTVDGLPAGNYYAITADVLLNHVNELFDNIPCVGGYCDPQEGTPIPVELGKTSSGVAITLDPGGYVSGNVLRAEDSKPLQDISIWVFDSNGNSVAYGYSDSSGSYTTLGGLASDNYFALTDNSKGYVNGLYRNITCTAGPGSCEPGSGTPIWVAAGSNTREINFPLRSILFRDDFDDNLLADDWNFSGSWRETGGMLENTTRRAIAVASPAFSGCSNCVVQADMQSNGAGPVSLIGWWSGAQQYVSLTMEEKEDRWILFQYFGKGNTRKSVVTIPIYPRVKYTVRIVFDGTEFHVSVGDMPILSERSLSPFFGSVGFSVSGAKAVFDNLQVEQIQ